MSDIFGDRFELPTVIPDGERNATLFKYACSLQAKGDSDATIHDSVHDANAMRCNPPLPADEVNGLIRSALSYEKGERRSRPFEFGEREEERVRKQPPSTPAAQLAEWINACGFKPGEYVCIVTDAKPKRGKPGEWRPNGSGKCHEVSELLAALECGDIEKAIGEYNHEAGVWACLNPTDGGGHKQENITAYRNVLVECDKKTEEVQLCNMRRMGLPARALTLSGGKSVHAIVPVMADGANHFKDCVRELFEICKENFLPVDTANSDPGRLTRIPGVQRGAREQRLIETNEYAADIYRYWLSCARKELTKRPPRFAFEEYAANMRLACGFCFIDGAPAVWNGAKYATGWDEAEKRMLDLNYKMSAKNRTEVRKYLALTAPREHAAPPNFIAFENGVLDIDTMELEPPSRERLITNIVPVEWKPDAVAPAVDAFLNDVSCNDTDVRTSLEEIAGMCIYRSARRAKMAVLIGEGSNGKSVYMSMLSALIGKENYSSVEPANLSKQFQSTPLMGKTANIAPDVPINSLNPEACAMLKKIVTGDEVPAEIKGGETFSFKSFAMMVISTNSYPKAADKTYGMARRLLAVPFDAQFKEGTPECDPDILDKLTTPEALSRLALLAVRALRGVNRRGYMTEGVRAKEKKEEVRQENDPLYRYCTTTIVREALIGIPTKKAFSVFKDWAEGEGCKVEMELSTFSKGVCSHFGLTTENSYSSSDHDKARRFVAKK